MSLDVPLVSAITNPDCLASFDARQWNLLLRQARSSALTARLHHRLSESGHIELVPDRARQIMSDAVVDARFNGTALAFEVNRVQRALSAERIPFIVLKGGAYLCAGLPIARGRLASDLDFLVRRESLDAARQSLLSAGWQIGVDSEYDVKYYEEWMHEIAPMIHAERQTTVDVHHTISPLTGRVHPDVDGLWAAAIEARPGIRVLAPADMVLHGALHLFNEEFTSGLRDLVDLHDLLRHFGKEPEFWSDLESAAERHGLERVLFYLVFLTTKILGTSVPAELLARARAAAPKGPIGPTMVALMELALVPRADARWYWPHAVALNVFYVRSHWLRMPPPLLFRHLSAKAWFRIRGIFPRLSET